MRCPRGTSLPLLEKALTAETDDCLLWPYAQINGYGQSGTRVHGTRIAHKIVCLLAHGEQPEGKEAAHKCGVRLCINPRHLYWATRVENMADMLGHHDPQTVYITSPKLTVDIVRAMRADWANGMRRRHIVAKYGVPKPTVSKVLYRATWKRVRQP